MNALELAQVPVLHHARFAPVPSETGRTLGAIELGHDAIRLKIVRATTGGVLEIVRQESAPIVLGRVLGRDLDEDEGYDRHAARFLVSTLRRYAGLCRLHGAVPRAVATRGFGRLSNSDALIEGAREDAGIDIEILSGRQEAHLLSLGVRQGSPDQALSLLMDLDEYGARLILVAGEQPIALWELGIDMQGWAAAFATVPKADRVGLVVSLRTRVGQIVSDGRLSVLRGAVHSAIAISGIAGAVVAFASTGGKRATSALLRRAVGKLLPGGSASPPPGSGGGGESLMASGAIVLETILDHLGIGVIQVVDRTLGDGVLVETNRRCDDADRVTPALA